MERFADLVLTWRRPLAAALAFGAVLAAVAAVRPEAGGRLVVVASHDLPSGVVLAAGDLTTRALPDDAVPRHSMTRIDDVVGSRLAGPVRSGEVVTDRRILEPRDLGGYADDGVLTTVRVADAAGLDAVRVGDVVDVVAIDPHAQTAPTVVAPGAVVAARPPADADRPDAAAALTVVTDPAAAVDLAAAALSTPLAVLVRAG